MERSVVPFRLSISNQSVSLVLDASILFSLEWPKRESRMSSNNRKNSKVSRVAQPKKYNINFSIAPQILLPSSTYSISIQSIEQAYHRRLFARKRAWLVGTHTCELGIKPQLRTSYLKVSTVLQLFLERAQTDVKSLHQPANIPPHLHSVHSRTHCDNLSCLGLGGAGRG